MAEAIPNQPGTYALLLACKRSGRLRVGKLGQMALRPGVYVYVGSARGPGGLAARITHHRRVSARPHWHVDYLRAVCDPVEVWFLTAADFHEHAGAGAGAELPGAAMPLPRFGASDCHCAAHLFWFDHPPALRTFRRVARGRIVVQRLPV
jgi:Uri superfamily endonuclease